MDHPIHAPGVLLPIANEPTTGSMRRHLMGALARIQPGDVRIATAYLTPDGFLDLRPGMEGVGSVRLLLGERPFMNRCGPAASRPTRSIARASEARGWTKARNC